MSRRRLHAERRARRQAKADNLAAFRSQDDVLGEKRTAIPRREWRKIGAGLRFRAQVAHDGRVTRKVQ